MDCCVRKSNLWRISRKHISSKCRRTAKSRPNYWRHGMLCFFEIVLHCTTKQCRDDMYPVCPINRNPCLPTLLLISAHTVVLNVIDPSHRWIVTFDDQVFDALYIETCTISTSRCTFRKFGCYTNYKLPQLDKLFNYSPYTKQDQHE